MDIEMVEDKVCDVTGLVDWVEPAVKGGIGLSDIAEVLVFFFLIWLKLKKNWSERGRTLPSTASGRRC